MVEVEAQTVRRDQGACLTGMFTQHLVERSATLGRHLLDRLQEVRLNSGGLVRAVRGRGLWVGVDLDPQHADAREAVERLALRGVLSKETHETVIRFAPPLTITQVLVDEAVDVFATVLADMREGRPAT